MTPRAALLTELREADPECGGLPRYVERELAVYLRCGVLAHGFARVRGNACDDELVVALSCKRRGICPSCTARRMADTAAHLVVPRRCVLPKLTRRLKRWRDGRMIVRWTVTAVADAADRFRRITGTREGMSRLDLVRARERHEASRAVEQRSGVA